MERKLFLIFTVIVMLGIVAVFCPLTLATPSSVATKEPTQKEYILSNTPVPTPVAVEVPDSPWGKPITLDISKKYKDGYIVWPGQTAVITLFKGEKEIDTIIVSSLINELIPGFQTWPLVEIIQNGKTTTVPFGWKESDPITFRTTDCPKTGFRLMQYAASDLHLQPISSNSCKLVVQGYSLDK
jgi:hypothetical protein